MRYEFGTLLVPFRASFGGVSIEPLEKHAQIAGNILAVTNKDGYFYPPTAETWDANPKTGKLKKRIPNTSRPASIYHLPASHVIKIDTSESTDFRFEDAGLFVHLLAFIFETRLQFSEWRFDGRVQFKAHHNMAFSEGVPEHFLECVYLKWQKWSEENRKRFVNILYVHTRSKSLEWEWDAFMWQYTTFDALYKLYSGLTGKTAESHPKRFNLLCDAFGIRYEKDLINEICNARRLLVHEAMWVEATIGHASNGGRLQSCLERFNERLICAIGGYENEFVRFIWSTMGPKIFDKANN